MLPYAEGGMAGLPAAVERKVPPEVRAAWLDAVPDWCERLGQASGGIHAVG